MDARYSCKWFSTGNVAEHNDKFSNMRTGMPFTTGIGTFNQGGGDQFLQSPAEVCILPPNRDDGVWTQRYITRIGPLRFTERGYYSQEYRDWGYLTPHQFNVVPAAPRGDTAIIESVDAVYDQNGNSFGYPPLHTHHVSSSKQGRWGEHYQQKKNRELARAFGPVFSQFGATSFRFADFVNCLEGESDTNACSYLKLPRSHAFFMTNGSLNAANGLYNIVGIPPKQDFDQDFFFEFGRTYTVRAPTDTGHRTDPLEGTSPEDRSDLFVWDFSVTGSGARYVPDNKPFGSVAWRVFQLPVKVRIRGSFMHTHSQVASEMFILQGDVERMLPSELVRECHRVSKCLDQGVSGIGTVPPRDMALTREMSTRVLHDVMTRGFVDNKTALRCQFKSRNEWVGSLLYTRSHYRARATANMCEEWIAEKGDKISMLVLTYPESPERKDIPLSSTFKNHHRWYAGVEILD